MKPYDHCEFEWERLAFAQLERLLRGHPGAEIYPNFHLFDESTKLYLEVDLLLIGSAFCAVVELKHWRGVIQIQPNAWSRGHRLVDDPHYRNLRKCKVLKSTMQRLLPAAHHFPFVHSIVVLTHPDAEVEGDDQAKTVLASGNMQAQITFNGIQEFADYLRKRLGHDRQHGKEILSSDDFERLTRTFDAWFHRQLPDYNDQIPGYRITQEIEHTHNTFVYLAEQIPPLDRQLFRLRVFGEESVDPQRHEQQYRSLKALASLQPHPHICPAWPHPNERKLVVEVSKWVDATTLKQRLLETGCMRWPHAAKITLGIAKALDHIHNSEAALIHRHVNPKAILLSGDNEPTLTDFDLVYDPAAYYTVMGADNEDLLTPYTAPETFRGAPDFNSDIYALGVTLYEMLVGSPPARDFYALAKEGGLAEEHINELPSDVPDNLTSLLRNMISLEPQNRPEASTIVERLTALLGEDASDASSLALQPGQTLNTWTLERCISDGTTSTVYLGDNLGEKAVLKIYKPNYPRDLCVQERDMLASVDSPYVARYKSFMQWADGRWCLVEEAVEGHSLRQLIDTGQRPHVEVFRSVASQLLAALHAMHPHADAALGTGVIHNDVSPNNVIYNDKLGIAKLIDFGAASRPGPVSIRGTRGYIAPDLIDHGELDACPEADLYAAAVTLFEWVTGRRPETK
jgi:serine/threonine protein kinase